MKNIKLKELALPKELIDFIGVSKTNLCSGCSGAETIYIDKDNGYFLKISEKDTLKKEKILGEYFSSRGVSAKIKKYISLDKDYLLTEKIKGEDGSSKNMIAQPERLCYEYAKALRNFHDLDFKDCPGDRSKKEIMNLVEENYKKGKFDKGLANYIGEDSIEVIYNKILEKKHLLKDDVIIHGDYCLPNIILDEFKFSGFIDIALAGRGDRHHDIFWALWSLEYNLKTKKYKDKFIDAYGRELVDFERLELCAYIATMQ